MGKLPLFLLEDLRDDVITFKTAGNAIRWHL
jgi:hypothetical protein